MKKMKIVMEVSVTDEEMFPEAEFYDRVKVITKKYDSASPFINLKML